MVEVAEKGSKAKDSVEFYRYICFLGSEWDKIRFLNENLDKNILLKVSDRNHSGFDVFRKYLLVRNPRNTSEVNVAYKIPGEDKGRMAPIRNLRKIDEVFIGGKNETPGPNEYFRPNGFQDIENYENQNALVKISSRNKESHYAFGNLYKSEKEKFYVSLDGGESKRSITRKSIDNLLIKV